MRVPDRVIQQKVIPVILSLLMVVVSTGCNVGKAKLFQSRRVEKQHQAGSVHVAVLSVAPWEEYMEALQPMFKLTEDEALKLVVPTTRTLESSLLDMMRAMGQYTHYKDVKDTTGISQSNQSGLLVQTDKPREPALEEGKKEATAGMDPLMRYWAATALFQEVQMLNRYVKDAAVRDGFTPYVVRMQVSLMPIARNEPYDAYSTMSFFSKAFPKEERKMAKGENRLGGLQTPLRGKDRSFSGDPEQCTPQIIPLMVTDNLEATLQSRTVQNVRQLAGAIYFLGGSGAGGANFNKFSDEFHRVFGKDLNSLLTVGRVSDNTLRIRLGASQQAGGNYAMVPRTHSITVLVMVPQGVPPTIEMVARTTMVDAETGETLPDRPPMEMENTVREILEKYDLKAVDSETLQSLLSVIQANDQVGFFKNLRTILGPDHPALAYEKALWVDLVTLFVGSQYCAAEFDLPKANPGGEEGTGIFPLQTALIVDDGKENSIVTLKEARIPDDEGIAAYLLVRSKEKEFPLLAIDASMAPGARDLLIRFPSLHVVGLGEIAKQPGSVSLMILYYGQSYEFGALYFGQQ